MRNPFKDSLDDLEGLDSDLLQETRSMPISPPKRTAGYSDLYEPSFDSGLGESRDELEDVVHKVCQLSAQYLSLRITADPSVT